jgi:hypothetical protein
MMFLNGIGPWVADGIAPGSWITHLEQQVIDLGFQLEERHSELAAARAANRELMT